MKGQAVTDRSTDYADYADEKKQKTKEADGRKI
jgi:hypothetical protein